MLGLDRPDHTTLRGIGVSTAAWSAVFIVLNAVLLRRRSTDFNNRAVSTLHALVALLICPLALNWKHPFSGFGEQTTSNQVDALCCNCTTVTLEKRLPDHLTLLAALGHDCQLGILCV